MTGSLQLHKLVLVSARKSRGRTIGPRTTTMWCSLTPADW